MLGTVDVIVFPEAYRRLSEKVKLEVPVLVRGGIRVEEGSNAKVTVSEIVPLEDAKPKLPRNIRIKVPLEDATPQTIDELHAFCSSHRGDARVLFDLERTGDFMVIMEAEDYNVLPDRAFFARVEELCGRSSVRIVD
jgi:DNA polymerase-3 subunit alpha